MRPESHALLSVGRETVEVSGTSETNLNLGALVACHIPVQVTEADLGDPHYFGTLSTLLSHSGDALPFNQRTAKVTVVDRVHIPEIAPDHTNSGGSA